MIELMESGVHAQLGRVLKGTLIERGSTVKSGAVSAEERLTDG